MTPPADPYRPGSIVRAVDQAARRVGVTVARCGLCTTYHCDLLAALDHLRSHEQQVP